ncbi:NlpC/P60 family protein [Streptomyces sp. NPDC049577]|uniref:C40 family peptidase n=1 Tax=Streptomyces sp. NPDC049577 TaxID=3155153 RepID=UPI003424734A
MTDVSGRTGGARRARRGGTRLVAATALVCGVVAGVLGMPGAAYADPLPPSSSSSSSSSPSSLAEVHQQVETLYRQAETATDAYNAASEQQRLQEKSIADLKNSTTAAQQRLDRLKDQAGALARAQYRSGGLPPQAQLMLSKTPQDFFDGVSLTRKSQQATRGLIAETTALRTELEGYTKAANERWKLLDAERKKKESAKKEIEAKLDEAKKLESRLQEQERDRLRQLEEEQARLQQSRWLNSTAGGVSVQDLLKASGAASAEGRRAIAFATAQIGKNYVWGAEGPDTYDCSGLTLKSWEAAGRAIPRTSQEQWRSLPKVDIRDMRPGDLIIYFSDASHVGMYVGDGMIVHAPRPGRQVTLAGAGTMPILGVVRPG